MLLFFILIPSLSNKEAIELRSKIAEILITDKDKEVNAILAKHHSNPSSVSRTQLEKTLANLVGMKDWSMTKYTSHSQNLQLLITLGLHFLALH